MASAVLILVLIAVFLGVVKLAKAARFLPQYIATKSSARTLADSEAEERLYDLVRQEYESGDIRSGLWTKAEATAKNAEKAEIRARYFQLRFEQLEAQTRLKRREANEGEILSPDEAAQALLPVQKSEVVDSKLIDSAAAQQGLKEEDDRAFVVGIIIVIVLFLLIMVAYALVVTEMN